MKKHICIVGIGSNIDPEENVEKALAILRNEQMIIRVSEFLKTAPVGLINQPDFLNGAVKIETDREMEDFNLYLKSVEDRLGRDHSEKKYGPRAIDLDIVTWDGRIVDKDYYVRNYLKQIVDEIL